MAIPSKKDPYIEGFLNNANPSGRKRIDSIQLDICAWCGEPALDFKEELSKKEYSISGLCQKCQDKIWH